ncbi:hypothetical protein [Sporosarcina sp. P1]|uniref:hypothetical protein n=1 Tax=Sporosarcina sp. P1 TaxID=2048257 RepID=UPI000C170D21|nr:hypothetical protein [Sporosarcina sp. P1]PIC83447.1 hypothetical protein CSV73_07760 [Sporosarcina sp. P1]
MKAIERTGDGMHTVAFGSPYPDGGPIAKWKYLSQWQPIVVDRTKSFSSNFSCVLLYRMYAEK